MPDLAGFSPFFFTFWGNFSEESNPIFFSLIHNSTHAFYGQSGARFLGETKAALKGKFISKLEPLDISLRFQTCAKESRSVYLFVWPEW